MVGEIDQTGAKLDRPMFQQALGRCEAGETGGVVVARLDRFARSAVDALSSIKRITVAGARLVWRYTAEERSAQLYTDDRWGRGAAHRTLQERKGHAPARDPKGRGKQAADRSSHHQRQRRECQSQERVPDPLSSPASLGPYGPPTAPRRGLASPCSSARTRRGPRVPTPLGAETAHLSPLRAGSRVAHVGPGFLHVPPARSASSSWGQSTRVAAHDRLMASGYGIPSVVLGSM